MDLPHYIYSSSYFSYFDEPDATPNDASTLALAKYFATRNILLVTERAKFCTSSNNYNCPSFARLFAASPTRIIFGIKRSDINLDKSNNN